MTSTNYGRLAAKVVSGITSLTLISAVILPYPSMVMATTSSGPTIAITNINGITPPFSFSCTTNPLFNPVSVSGNGAGIAPPGDASQYKVQIDWGDGNATNDLGTFTPNSGHVAFTFTYSGSHTYASTGNFVINAKLYHSNPPGHDNQGDSSVSISTCVHVPPPTTGAVTVKKVVVNNDGGTAQASDYTLKVGATTVTNGFVQDFTANTYAITESGPSGYTASFSGDCDSTGNLTVVAGHVYTCTITNDDNAVIYPTPYVTPYTYPTPAYEYPTPAYDYPTPAYDYPTPAYEYPTPAYEYPTPAYETPYESPYATPYPTPAPVQGTLIVIKHVINDDYGTKSANDFSMHVKKDGTSEVAGSPFAGSETGTTLVLDIGSYVVSETPDAGYLTTIGGDCTATGSISWTGGATKTCTITNDDVKDVTPPVSTYGDARNHLTVLDASVFPMALSGSTDDDLSGVASAEAHIVKMADASLVDSEQYGSFYESLNCAAEGPGISTKIVPLTLSTPGAKHVTWNYDWTPSARGIFCFEVHATDVAGNVEHTGISGPVSVLASLTPPVTTTGGGGGGGGGGNGGGGGLLPPGLINGGQVAGASTGEVLGAETTCGIYLNDYLKMGKSNNAEEVKKLQTFLNENLRATLPVTGYFGSMTFGAVKDFQVKYFEDVLKPWVAHGLPTEKTPTGYVYKTTKRWINHLKCIELDLPVPQLP